MATEEDLVVEGQVEEEESGIPDEVQSAAQVVAVWGVKSIISCIKKRKKDKPQRPGVKK